MLLGRAAVSKNTDRYWSFPLWEHFKDLMSSLSPWNNNFIFRRVKECQLWWINYPKEDSTFDSKALKWMSLALPDIPVCLLPPRTPSFHYQWKELAYRSARTNSTNTDFTSGGSWSLGTQSSRLSKSSPISSESSTVSTKTGTVEETGTVEGMVAWGMLGKLTKGK